MFVFFCQTVFFLKNKNRIWQVFIFIFIMSNIFYYYYFFFVCILQKQQNFIDPLFLDTFNFFINELNPYDDNSLYQV